MRVIRIALRVLVRVVAVLSVPLAAALYFYSFHLPGIVESEILAALEGLGLPDATARVVGIGLDGAVLTDLDLDGTGRVRVETVEVRYRLREVLDGHIRNITVTGLSLTLGYAGGQLDLGPLGRIESTGEGGGAGELPFLKINLRACRLIVDFEGEIRHFPLDGLLTNAGQGRIAFALTSRFMEQPVAIEGRADIAELAVDARVAGNGFAATVLYEQARDTLAFTVAGRRDRLSLFLGDRPLVGEGLEVDLRGRVSQGKLTRASLAAKADRVEFDGRVLRNLTADLGGDMDLLTGSVSARCDLVEVGLDVGETASAFVGGVIGVYPTSQPLRVELMAVDAKLRDLDVAGFEGSVEAEVVGEVTEEGAKLDIRSAEISGQVDAAPGPLSVRLGEPGTVTATLAGPLDWRAGFPEVRVTATPTLEGIGTAEVRAVAEGTATPDQIVAVVAPGSGVKAAALGFGGVTAEGLAVMFGGTVTLLPTPMKITVDGVAEVVADAIRGRGWDAGLVTFSGAGQVARKEGSLEFSMNGPATVTAASVHVGKLSAVEFAVESGLRLSMTPEKIDVSIPGTAALIAAAVRYDEFEFETLALGLHGTAEAIAGDFAGGIELMESLIVDGPALSCEVSDLVLQGAGRFGKTGDIEAVGHVAATMIRGSSEAGNLSLDDLRLDLPLVWGKPERAEPGTLRIGKLKLLGQTFPGPRLALVQEGEGIEFEGDWPATGSALFKLSGDARLTSKGLISRTEFTSEPFYVAPAGPFGAIVKRRSGVALTGVVSARGRIVLDRGRIEPEVVIGLSQAEVSYQEDTIALGNVNAEVTIDSFPPTTPGGQRVSWESARFGKIDFGAGLVEFQLERGNAIAVEQIRVRTLPRGEVWAHSFRVHPANLDLAIELYCQDVSLSRWLTIFAEDKASAEGQLSGRLPIRIRTKPKLRIDFSPGYLTAAPGGWFRVHDMRAVTELLDEHMPSIVGETDYSQVVKERVVQALRNFEYSTLRFEIIQNEWNQTLRIKASGRGREIPAGLKNAQELDLTVNVNGFDTLIETALAMKLGIEKLFKGD